MIQQAPAHLSVVVLKVAQLEALLQFGLMPHPELIESPFCLVQLRQQSERGAEEDMGTARDGGGLLKNRRLSRPKAAGGEMNRAEKAAGMLTEVFGYFFLCVSVCACYAELMPVDMRISVA